MLPPCYPVHHNPYNLSSATALNLPIQLYGFPDPVLHNSTNLSSNQYLLAYVYFQQLHHIISKVTGLVPV